MTNESQLLYFFWLTYDFLKLILFDSFSKMTAMTSVIGNNAIYWFGRIMSPIFSQTNEVIDRHTYKLYIDNIFVMKVSETF